MIAADRNSRSKSGRSSAALLVALLLPCSLALAAAEGNKPAAVLVANPVAATAVAPVATVVTTPVAPPITPQAPAAPTTVAPAPEAAAASSAPAAPIETVGDRTAATLRAASVPAPAGSPATVAPAAPAVQPVSPRSATPASTSSAAGAAVASAAGLTQVAMVLVLIVAMIAAVAWLLKRLGMARAAGGSTIRVVSGVNLSNRERILVVEIADQWIVVGVTAGSINTLATMPRQDNPAGTGTSGLTPPGGKNFALWLKQTIDKRNRAAGNPGSING